MYGTCGVHAIIFLERELIEHLHFRLVGNTVCEMHRRLSFHKEQERNIVCVARQRSAQRLKINHRVHALLEWTM
jgi:hypothetical protein